MPSQPPVPSPERRAGERIAKLLARAGIASRREVERMIAEGRVARDGILIDTPATVLTTLDGITVDGQPVAAPAATRLFVYHKPIGLLVTERDPAGRPTVYDRLPPELPRVVPVGRLDLATEGLLLLTTDGGLKRQLELPATGVERTYRARAYGPVTQAQLEELIHGVEIEGMRYGPIDANLERRTGANGWIELTLTEGKNREVRRVLEYLGLEVSRLIRTRYGPFVLGDMGPGDVGEIRQHDLEGFRKTLKIGGGKTVGGALQPVTAEPLVKPAAVMAAPATARPRPATRPIRREGSERHAEVTSRRPPQAKLGKGGGAKLAARETPLHHRGTPGGPLPRASLGRSESVRSPMPASQTHEGRAKDDAPRPQRPTSKSGWARPKPPGDPKPSRPANDRSPSGDRSRGPAGGRGKPQDPRRPKTPPRGKR